MTHKDKLQRMLDKLLVLTYYESLMSLLLPLLPMELRKLQKNYEIYSSLTLVGVHSMSPFSKLMMESLRSLQLMDIHILEEKTSIIG